ncbi:hypothetical protein ElyMa_000891800 [Elysia marginata]|uniref:Uncharacterized protein n=1 Tax=Elysia marginata TaxID=1093978 RepID=A0AAV4H672_9GAST|nr:hypothetical protein ElyMa_000891800 [Elysia marginata]
MENQYSRSREDRKSLSESFVDGTSKFFSSMVAKKNGLISDLSNKIETTFATKSDRASSSAGSEGSVSPPMSPQPVPNTPPPRPPPPPRRQPSIEAIKQARSSMKRMTSVPAYPSSGRGGQYHQQGRGQTSERVGKDRRQSDAEDKLSVNGMNISFDEPIYNKPEEPPAPKPLPRKTFGPRDSDSSPNRGSYNQGGREESSIVPTSHKSNHNVSANAAVPVITQNTNVSSSSPSFGNNSSHATEVPSSKGNSRVGSGSEQGSVVAEGYGEIVSPETTSAPRGKAPKFTATTRRSSTVDEMLFDDYVPPEVEPVPIQSTEEIPDNLISFEPDTEASACSPSSSSSDIESGGVVRHSNSRRPKAGASVDSSDVEFGGTVIPRSGSLGSEKSWSSNYSVDSQPDDLTLECMEFMKAFVDKIFHGGDDISQTDKANFGRLCQKMRRIINAEFRVRVFIGEVRSLAIQT